MHILCKVIVFTVSRCLICGLDAVFLSVSMFFVWFWRSLAKILIDDAFSCSLFCCCYDLYCGSHFSCEFMFIYCLIFWGGIMQRNHILNLTLWLQLLLWCILVIFTWFRNSRLKENKEIWNYSKLSRNQSKPQMQCKVGAISLTPSDTKSLPRSSRVCTSKVHHFMLLQ